MSASHGCCLQIALLLLGGVARAEAPLLPDLQRIADAGKLVVAVVGTAEKPMVTRDEQGRLGGFDVELARAMVRALDVKAVFRQDAATPDGVVELVARGEADLGISLLSVTAQRAKHVLFSRPYATQHATVLIHRTRGLAFQRRCPEEKEILALAHEPDEVGVLEKSAYAGRVRDLDAKATTRKYESLEALFAAVRQGEVTMAFAGEIAARDYLRRQPAASIRLKLCLVGNASDSIAIAVRPDAFGLVRWIDAFLQENDIQYDAATVAAHEGRWRFGSTAQPLD
jgi:ABC-type amino acid transport substrate-binding protein